MPEDPFPLPPHAVTGLVDPPAELPIAFDPVPRRRNALRGWSEETSRAFIAAIAKAASVRVETTAPLTSSRRRSSPGDDE